jgi:hypothetical protein
MSSFSSCGVDFRCDDESGGCAIRYGRTVCAFCSYRSFSQGFCSQSTFLLGNVRSYVDSIVGGSLFGASLQGLGERLAWVEEPGAEV